MSEAATIPSTVIDTDPSPAAGGGGQPKLTEEPSLRDTIAAAVKDDAEQREEPAEEKDEKQPEQKADKQEKDGPDDKPEKDESKADEQPKKEAAKKADDGNRPEAAEKEQSEKQPEMDKAEKRHVDAPRTFLPKAKEVWANTPRVVQQEVDRMVREHEENSKRFEEVSSRYEAIREYDELARSNGTDLKTALSRVSELEGLMKANPLAALNRMLIEAGPRKADGQPISLFEVAKAVVESGPQQYQQMVRQQPQQPQQNSELESIKAELAELKQQQLAVQIIEPFKASHPRYAELEGDIAFFLHSGKIPDSLSPSEKLEAAYDMAERINPPSNASPALEASPAQDDRRADSLSGSKSIKSAPGSVSPDMEPERGGSIRELLADEMRRAKRS